MSTLMLDGHPPDLVFQKTNNTYNARHHLRIWKAPFAVEGQTLWVGAGTHDIGFEKDQRNNGVTHKIDPAIDGGAPAALSSDTMLATSPALSTLGTRIASAPEVAMAATSALPH